MAITPVISSTILEVSDETSGSYTFIKISFFYTSHPNINIITKSLSLELQNKCCEGSVDGVLLVSHFIPKMVHRLSVMASHVYPSPLAFPTSHIKVTI